MGVPHVENQPLFASPGLLSLPLHFGTSSCCPPCPPFHLQPFPQQPKSQGILAALCHTMSTSIEARCCTDIFICSSQHLPLGDNVVLLHAEAAGSLKSKLPGRGVELDPRLGSCSQAPGAGTAGSESSQLCPFRRTRCSIPAWIPSCAGHTDTPSLAHFVSPGAHFVCC